MKPLFCGLLFCALAPAQRPEPELMPLPASATFYDDRLAIDGGFNA